MPEIDHSGSIYTMEISKYSTLGPPPSLLQSESQLLPLTRKNNTDLKLQAS